MYRHVVVAGYRPCRNASDHPPPPCGVIRETFIVQARDSGEEVVDMYVN
jgi:hypothetical protein